MKQPISSLMVFVMGLAMGAADAIPGVSGGTIALITGIYERLINSLKSFDHQTLKLLFAFKLKEIWVKVDGKFLLSLLIGIAVSIISLARLITYLLKTFPISLWSFFFGLIIISSLLVLREIKLWKWHYPIMISLGIIIAYFITSVTPATTPTDYWFILVSGAIAICAMILPGISGAFILLLLGKYEFIYQALRDFNVMVILVFILGCVIGILSFSKFLSLMLRRFHHATIALLSGFMIGSLNKIWPWKIVSLYHTNSNGIKVPLVEENVLPGAFVRITGENAFVLEAVLFMALGILVVIAIERFSKNK